MNAIEQLVALSRKYGADSRFVIAGGGNTSFKDDKDLWVKASGHALATIDENGFAVLDRSKLSARAGNGVGYKYRGNFLYAVDASGNETLESRMKQCREYLRSVKEKIDSLDKE